MAMFKSDSVTVERDEDGSVMVILDVPGKSVNLLGRQLLADLDAALDSLFGKIPVLVVRSGKSSGFLAGADVRDFAEIRTAAEAAALAERGQKLFDKLANLQAPTIAAISGPCLGGGLELALACDYRLVFDKAKTKLGFPEVRLGLLPAWGGTQRLPRAVGLGQALVMILNGKELNAREAIKTGLADAIATTEAELRDQFTALKNRAIKEGKRVRKAVPLRTWREKMLESTGFGRRLVFRTAERLLERKVPDDMPAPREALQAVRVGLTQGMEAGLEAERAAASRLALTPACRHLVGLFLSLEQSRKLPASLTDVSAPGIKRVGVVGAGVMGAGIAQLAALKGCDVVIQEVNADALGAGLLRINQLFGKAVQRGVMTPAERDKRLAGVKGTVSWEWFDDVDLVIEAAVEDLGLKQKLFRELEGRTRTDTILATNTSSLPVTKLQEGLRHPGRVAGLHFFNPVHKLPLVEVVRAAQSDDETLAALWGWAVELGKTPVLVKDSPGFVVNRVLMPYLNEAVLLVAEGLRIVEVDKVMTRFGMLMGPLLVLDEIGLDVAAHVARSMAPSAGDRFPPSTAFERMVGNDWLGAKNGRGFYRHKGKVRKENVLARNLLRSEAPPSGKLSAALSPAARLTEARERMVLLMVNEAAMCLQEGLAADAETIDLALVMGTGWAPHRGGPLHYADDRGPAEVVKALEGLAARHGRRFEPCDELRRRAGATQRFTRLVATPAGA